MSCFSFKIVDENVEYVKWHNRLGYIENMVMFAN